ncbi:uncharacterized protein BYT42DRAFT_645514 [Radiomyces spectabilis]|uniref:uncharacterized protein n=1 Tax=Radiomyces spectabilis TaxID=64574 RepID=UPI0022204B3E|nr:uncharacterized protein BYT42DRAFT_645514 [Radiomyces spectabilis]KAI8377988.1 hypothetical protein BYT42DRAFT_645514 [Radiomyces spectabilis]
MVDGTWIFAIATCAFWIILATCTCVAKPIKRHSVGRLPTEMKWTDYTTTHTSHHAAVAPAHPKAQYDYTAYDNPSTMRKPEKSMESMNTIQLPIHADPDYMMRYQAYPSMSPHAIDDQYQSRFRSPSVHTYYPSQAPTPVMPKAPSLVDQTWKLEYVPPIPIHTFEVPTSALQHPQTPAMSTTPTTPVSVRQPLPVSYDFHPNPPYEHIDSDRRSSATSLLFHPPPPFTPPTDTKHAVSE